MRKSIIFVWAAVLSMLVGMAAPMNVYASKKSEAYAAYYKVVKKLHNKGVVVDKDLKDEKYKFDKYKLIYLDDDKIPELVVEAEYPDSMPFDHIHLLYTYNGGKVKKLGIFTSPSAGGYGNAMYIKKSGKVCDQFYGTGGDGYDKIYKMKQGKLEKKAKGEFDLSTNKYKWKGKSISQKAYEKRIKKIFKKGKAILFSELKYISYSKMSKKLGNCETH